MGIFRDRRLFEATTDGRFAVRLAPESRAWVVELADQLDELLDLELDDTRRLFPTAYPNDPQLDAAYQILGRSELIDERRAAIDTMRETVTAPSLSETELVSWLTIINDLRLVLGTRLDVSEEDDEAPADDDERAAFMVYHQLGSLLGEIVDTLAGVLPPEGRPDAPEPPVDLA
ncbi:MAG: DUF2017 family protein [Acidimicrobiales bacterium]